MTAPKFFICKKCGNIVGMVYDSKQPLSCCGEAMQELVPNTVDAAKEKHVPVVEKIPGGYRVSVGSDEHPMTEAHYIQFIELVTEDGVLRKDLTPSDKPVAEFQTDAQNVFAREYCNLHGLWKS